MEDFSVFYSRSLSNLDNYCRRLHFFRGDSARVEQEFRKLALSRRSLGVELHRRRSARFSRKHYLGFAVIKPLPGTPVGRTALRSFPENPGPGPGKRRMTRSFAATRQYHAHLLGVELSVQSLAFQQQDVGVAACATTAIWTSLQKNREKEELGVTTPAHITTRATHNRMPFGRSMPSEGLSIDQMCQAIQSFGLSPVLSPAKDFIAIRAALYAALQSDLSPVLVIQRDKAGRTDEYHAVSAVGMKLSADAQAVVQADYAQASDHLEALYIHDDRYGPFLLAGLSQRVGGGVDLNIRVLKLEREIDRNTGEISINGEDETEQWIISHVLIPSHAKLRLSFPELHELSLRVMEAIDASLNSRQPNKTFAKSLDFWVSRSNTYLDRIGSSTEPFSPSQAVAVASGVPMARYVGILRTAIAELGTVDVIVDTTSTDKNPVFLAGVCSAGCSDELESVVAALGRHWGFQVFLADKKKSAPT